ncbi:uncharacterized protein HMPREF1541_00825 [Cyphellophora europaea CBS 101466]|uniref:Uncharacterized protein n=1 Tax=Cyphellophora europaea (strain CBS 101466) TaxID=1220924 RepID=W2SFF3_CYPE1|nr:uncharacterized protein HMPREF1541_00825 [Cyphellophora europaea CBS 101466]ETN46639.1 hypothetical protein HMPREF1541_00825 [Cyphellophora europaea CBS 101466]
MTSTPRQHSRNPSIPAHVVLSDPTELDLSPSKARAYHATTHAWTQVSNWLTQVLPSGRLPPFEQNVETLAYLQSLMHANRAADKERQLLFEAQEAQVKIYQEHAEAAKGSQGAALMGDLAGALGSEGEDVLSSLAEATIRLNHLPPEPDSASPGGSPETELGQRMLGLTLSIFELEQELASLSELRSSLEAQTSTAVPTAAEDEDAQNSIVNLRQQTSQLTAQTKHLSLKIAEYQDRIAALSRADGYQGIDMNEVKQTEKEVAAQRVVVRKLEERLKEYHGLPPDLEASRAEVRRAQGELERWKRKREEVFEGIGGL